MTSAALIFAFLAGGFFESALFSRWLGLEWRWDAAHALAAAVVAVLMATV